MIDLDKLLELEAKATPGPWKNFAYAESNQGMAIIVTGGPEGKQAEDNAILMAATRNSIRELCIELKAARKVIECSRRFEWDAFCDDSIAMETALMEYDEARRHD
jgi:hypothetical protein